VIEGGCKTVRVNTHEGGFRTIDGDRMGWFLHPDGDDLAVAPLGINSALLKVAYVPFEMAVPREVIDGGVLGVGDEAFFIGRFVYRDGKIMNTPTARFGSIAQVGGDPIVQKERQGFRQESFLVEAHSLSGFSGSPVFAYRGARFAPHAEDSSVASIVPQVGSRVYLLGVDWGSDPWTADVLDANTHKAVNPAEYVRASSGMSLIVPAWKLRGALDHPDLVEFRRIREGLMRHQQPDEGREAAVLDSATGPTPFSRDDFDDALGRATRLVIPPDESVPEG